MIEHCIGPLLFAIASLTPPLPQVETVRGFDINDVQLSWFRHGDPGVLVLRNETRYPLTWDDVEWVAKMVWGESMDGDPVHAASVIWSVMQRADIFWPSVGRDFDGRLSGFIRKFSQPIRPPYPRRPSIVAASWDQIPVYARQMALAFAMGLLPNPIPGAVDFANRNQPVGSALEPVAWIGYRGPTTGNIFYARMVGSRSSKSFDWSKLRVESRLGRSGMTTEAFELFGRTSSRTLNAVGELVPGGRELIRRITGR